MADGIIKPCNVACGSGIMTVNSPSGSTLQCHTWLCDAILDFRVPIMGSLKSPSRTSYRSSIDTMALHCLVFEKIAFLYFSDKQTDEQTNRWTGPMHQSAVAIASGVLIIASVSRRYESPRSSKPKLH